MSDHAHYEDMAAVHALGALDGADLVDFEVHLKGCPACSAAVREFASAADRLVPAGAAPPSLRSKVLPKRRARGPIVAFLAAAAALLLAVNLLLAGSRTRDLEDRLAKAEREVEDLERLLGRMNGEVEELHHRLKPYESPDVRRFVLVPSGAAGGSALVAWNPKGGCVWVRANGLPALSADERYVLWMIAGDRLAAVADFTAMDVMTMAEDGPPDMAANPESFAISVETERRPTSHSGRIVLAGRVK